MSTVRELLTNVANNTRKFLGTEEELSLADMSQGIDEASDESDFQTELIEEFSTILDRSVAPDNYVNGKEDGFADALEKRTDLVATENREYTPEGESTGFKKVLVNTPSRLNLFLKKELQHITADDLVGLTEVTGVSNQNMETVYVPDGVTSLGTSSFYGCKKLKSIRLPLTLTKIMGASFRECSALETFSMPDSVSTLQASVFMFCTSLREVKISASVQTLGTSLFQGCTSLEAITVPSSVTAIANTCFQNCTALETVKILATTPPTLNSSAFSGCTALKEIAVPIGSGDTYKAATNWSVYADIIVEEEM